MTYRFWGKVTYGEKRGKSLGFPTANLRLHKVIPEGVYVSLSKLNGKWHRSVTFVGKTKTFGGEEIHAETYILNYDFDMYGKWVSVKLLKKIRENMKFASAGELIKNIKKDIGETKEYFRQHTP